MIWTRDEYVLDDNRSRLSMDEVVRGLRMTSWAAERPEAMIRGSWENSALVFGLYHQPTNSERELIGFCRVVTDLNVVAYFADVVVFPDYRRRGLAHWMLECIIGHPELRTLRRWLLNTVDMQDLYRKVGFVEVGGTVMSRTKTASEPDANAQPKNLMQLNAGTPHVASQNSYEEALGELLKLEFFGMKLGLQNITALMEFLGHPERTYPTIHIAGTNGKGSVAALLAAIYQSDGKRVGLYTSPHLVDFRERIKVDGVMVLREFIRDFLARIWPLVLELKATFFEVTTALAFHCFRASGVDIAIIETGLGGRLDATNVLEHPLATVVTSIGWDHMAQLGTTLESIAREKAGIFKRGSVAIVNVKPNLRSVFEEHAKEVGTEIYFVENTEASDSERLVSPLSGAHQASNLRTVLATLGHLSNSPNRAAVEQGVMNVNRLIGFRGRLETIDDPEMTRQGVRVLADVGHNLDAVRAVKEYFVELGVRPIVVAGIMKDKDIAAILSEYLGFAKEFIAVEAPTHRALAAAELAASAREAGLKAEIGGCVLEGYRLACSKTNSGDIILVSGSHYVIGELLANQSLETVV